MWSYNIQGKKLKCFLGVALCHCSGQSEGADPGWGWKAINSWDFMQHRELLHWPRTSRVWQPAGLLQPSCPRRGCCHGEHASVCTDRNYTHTQLHIQYSTEILGLCLLPSSVYLYKLSPVGSCLIITRMCVCFQRSAYSDHGCWRSGEGHGSSDSCADLLRWSVKV